jgi:hypothetical protein
MTIEEVARVCHEANRAYCTVIGDYSALPWAEVPERQRECIVTGVAFLLAHPEASQEIGHVQWFEIKRAAGWKYGPVKDAAKKEHPCCLPYNQLPPEQQKKDALFQAIVRTLGN